MEKIKKYIPFNNIPIIILLCLFDIIIIGIDCEFRNALIIVKRFTEMFFILTCCFMVLSKLKVYINFCITAVGVLSAIAFLLELHCLKSFGFRVNETIVQAILLTNRREALEYLYGYIGIKELILVIMTIVGLIIAIRFSLCEKHICKQKVLTNVIVLLYLWGGVQLSVSFVESYRVEKNMKSSIVKYFDEYSMIRCVNVTRFAIKDLNIRKNSNKIATVIKNNSDIDNVVLVMGESSTRSHLSVYGYYLKTTPYLEEWNSSENLIAFDNVISSFCGTNPSSASMFTFRNYENNMPWNKSENLISIMNECQYKTYWISNQEKVDSWGSAIAAFSDCARVKYYTNEFASPRDGRSGRYDELVLDFLNRRFEKSKKNFFVFHLMGSHEIFSERYPEKYRIFSSYDIKDNVIEYISESGLKIRRMITLTIGGKGPSFDSIQNANHAINLVQQVVSSLAQRTTAERRANIHIFASAPNAFMFFLGQRSRGFGNCILYEFDLEAKDTGTYSTSFKNIP